MTRIMLAAAAVVMAGSLAFAQSQRQVKEASPYVEVENEPPPKLIVDQPLPDGLSKGIVWIQYRVENVRILPVFGPKALSASPRIGHLHIQVDDLPWLWAEASNNNTIDVVGLPVGDHKIKIDLVDTTHRVFPGQSRTVRFTVTGSIQH